MMAYVYFISKEIDGDHIEAADRLRNRIHVIIHFRDALKLRLLSRIDRSFRRAVTVILPSLHFDEDKAFTIIGDNIDLAHFAKTEVPLYDSVAERGYMLRRVLLAQLCQLVARKLRAVRFNVAWKFGVVHD